MKVFINVIIDLLRKSMDWFLYDIGLRHERVNQNVFHHLLLNKNLNIFLIKQLLT